MFPLFISRSFVTVLFNLYVSSFSFYYLYCIILHLLTHTLIHVQNCSLTHSNTCSLYNSSPRATHIHKLLHNIVQPLKHCQSLTITHHAVVCSLTRPHTHTDSLTPPTLFNLSLIGICNKLVSQVPSQSAI